MATVSEPIQIRDIVREKYAEAARQVAEADGCCGPGCCRSDSLDPVTSNLYDAADIAAVPGTALAVSLGCGNPTALAQLNPARPCSIWAAAAASTSCSRPDGSVRQASPTVWT